MCKSNDQTRNYIFSLPNMLTKAEKIEYAKGS